MWNRYKLHNKLKEVDQKLKADDALIRQLSVVVTHLREVTKETEMILRALREDESYMEDDK